MHLRLQQVSAQADATESVFKGDGTVDFDEMLDDIDPPFSELEIQATPEFYGHH